MVDKGGTYTIVVDKDGEIVSATYNGVMMTDRPGNVIGRHPEEVGENRTLNLTLPRELSSCICLAQFINKQQEQGDPDCVVKWGKLI